jgi:hypothetical protein
MYERDSFDTALPHTHTTQKEKEKYLKKEEKKRVLESISFTPVRESPTRYYIQRLPYDMYKHLPPFFQIDQNWKNG